MNLTQIADKLLDDLAGLTFPKSLTVYNPLVYARAPFDQYVKRYGRGQREVVLLGINPGPWGMAQTGVPFGDVPSVRDWMGVEASVEKPANERPDRPVMGFACPRREVSGTRLWGWAGKRFGPPETFFKRFFVANYCPLCFFDAKGTNLTPDKLPKAVRGPLLVACDEALRRQVEYFQPGYVVGVGVWAEGRARAALDGAAMTIGRIPHPSPASPRSHHGWPEQVDRALNGLGIES